MDDTRYDVIGAEYAVTRREDPRTAALIHAALGEQRRSPTSAPALARTSRAIGM